MNNGRFPSNVSDWKQRHRQPQQHDWGFADRQPPDHLHGGPSTSASRTTTSSSRTTTIFRGTLDAHVQHRQPVGHEPGLGAGERQGARRLQHQEHARLPGERLPRPEVLVVLELLHPDLGYDMFADTFEDVTPNESAFFNPFNAMYYELFFKGIADGGNCSGMNTEQLVGRARPFADRHADPRRLPGHPERQRRSPPAPTLALPRHQHQAGLPAGHRFDRVAGAALLHRQHAQPGRRVQRQQVLLRLA